MIKTFFFYAFCKRVSEPIIFFWGGGKHFFSFDCQYVEDVSIGLTPPPPPGATVNYLLTQNDIVYYKNSFIKMTFLLPRKHHFFTITLKGSYITRDYSQMENKSREAILIHCMI